VTFDPNFSKDDFLHGNSSLRLMVAMLVVPQLLVGEYENSGNAAALEAARSYLRGWWRFEKATVLPTGMQWNDHAVAGRVFPLTAYLCASKRKGYPDVETSEIVSALLTTGSRLLKPGSFTFRTNHGLMQTVALLHLAAMFPSLPQARESSAVAAERLADQLDFSISQDGVVLEHSSEYHVYGLHLLSLALRYLDELHKPIPARLEAAFPHLIRFHAQLRRPDGTLPAWGNTQHGTGLPLVAHKKDSSESVQLSRGDGECEMPATFVAPVGGVAVWWDRAAGKDCGKNRVEQALVVWSDYRQAHKHVDEMSVFVWARGFNVLTGSGYWPYGAPHGREALGWGSGNSPRYEGEVEAERGTTVLLRFASSARAEYIELVRESPAGARLRREILYVRPGRWWLIDTDEAVGEVRGRSFLLHLTIDPRLALKATAPPLSYALIRGSEVVAHLQFAGCAGGRIDVLRASTEPFLGWTAAFGRVEPAYALRRQCPAGSTSFVSIELPMSSALEPKVWFKPPEVGHDWALSANGVKASRIANQIRIRMNEGDSSEIVLDLDSAQDHSEAKKQIDGAYRRALAKYDRYVESWGPWRAKFSRAIGVAFLVQVVISACAWAVARRSVRLRPILGALGAGGLVCWSLLAAWLGFHYFA
jgi:hypothetical protein